MKSYKGLYSNKNIFLCQLDLSWLIDFISLFNGHIIISTERDSTWKFNLF